MLHGILSFETNPTIMEATIFLPFPSRSEVRQSGVHTKNRSNPSLLVGALDITNSSEPERKKILSFQPSQRANRADSLTDGSPAW